VRRAASVAAENGQTAARRVKKTTAAAAETGRATGGDVAGRTATAARAGRSLATNVVSRGAAVAGGLAKGLGSTLLAAAGAGLSVVVDRTALLLQLIKRFALLGVAALARLVGWISERVASTAGRFADAAAGRAVLPV
jgi:hypothetical protein